MKWYDWLNKWGMTSLKINAVFLKMEFEPKDQDRTAAWELYIELLTRITTQPLADKDGDEKIALENVHIIFPLTREIIKNNGRGCSEFTKIAIVILNQKIRPFTARWHKLSIQGAFDDPNSCKQFREELSKLQCWLRKYTKALADMAGVEDLTDLEDKET